MKMVALFGAGKLGHKAYSEYKDAVECFIDNNKAGSKLFDKPILSLDEFTELPNFQEIDVKVCVADFNEIIKQLERKGINYSLYKEIYLDPEANLSIEIAHGNWSKKIKELCDKEGLKILEVGSRVVTGANYRTLFEHAEYTGFDLYDGPNVDVVGDAHRLSSYFEGEKFDLIFCSAVFEHFAMPWVVADEMIKLCKDGGYIFVETHYSYSSHERPWHFFQFSEQALKVLFSEDRGIKCIEAGVCNPIVGYFTDEASEYLRGNFVGRLYCHSEFLGKKVRSVENLGWNQISDDLGMYPQKKQDK